MAPRVDYEQHGHSYTRYRQPDPRIAQRIERALGDAQTVLNVGAGAGSYEPKDRWVLAVEPSATMRSQRPADAAPVISAHAEDLPLDDDAVDAAMACVTIHHWEPPEAGLAEMRRVARSRVVVFTFELDDLPGWQQDYLAAGLNIERSRFPSMRQIAHALGGQIEIERIRTPSDCVDGFFEAFWNRPEALLDPEVRASQSMWALLEPGIEEQIVDRLRVDLHSGAWDDRYGYLREMTSYDGALRLVVAENQPIARAGDEQHRRPPRHHLPSSQWPTRLRCAATAGSSMRLPASTSATARPTQMRSSIVRARSRD